MQGGDRYRVELAVEEEGIRAACDCPMGASGAFCKHCVAVALALAEGALPDGGRVQAPLPTREDVRAHLTRLPLAELADLLMSAAEADRRLFERLRLLTTTASPDFDTAALRSAIELAVDPGGYIGYRGAPDYFGRVDDAIDSVAAVLSSGRAPEAIELAEHFLEALEEVGGMVDDSDGGLGLALDRLQSLHRDACEQAEVDPAALAERLFEQMLASEWELFYDAVSDYEAVLGEPGLARYAELARAEWEKLPERGPGAAREYGGLRFRLEHAMEQLAERDGTLEELTGIMSRDLSSPYRFLRIAEACRAHGAEDAALEWAERGMAAFPERPDSRLVEFVADAYRRRGRAAEAVELVWALFAERPDAGGFEQLKPYAEAAGEWPQRRQRALELVRKRIEAAESEARRRGYGWSPYRDHSELVEIFLSEGDLEAALSEAREGGCSEPLAFTLAERLEPDRPTDALELYRERIEPTIQGKRKSDYREAVALIGKVGELLARLGREAELPDLVGEIRATHRRKRSFMKLLDEAGHGAPREAAA